MFVLSNKKELLPSFLKLRTMLAEGTAVWSLANRLYSSTMYSGGSLARGRGRGLCSVTFSVDRNWLRKSCASSSRLSRISLPTVALWRLSGDLRGLLKLKPVNVRRRTLKERINQELEKTAKVMVELRKGLDPEYQMRMMEQFTRGRLSFVNGQQVAVGGKENTALPLLIWWFGSEGRAVLSNVLCSSLSPLRRLMTSH